MLLGSRHFGGSGVWASGQAARCQADISRISLLCTQLKHTLHVAQKEGHPMWQLLGLVHLAMLDVSCCILARQLHSTCRTASSHA